MFGEINVKSFFEYTIGAELHNYNTRARNDIRLPEITSGFACKSVIYKAIKLWNTLPNELKILTNKSTLKIKYKNYLLSGY